MNAPQQVNQKDIGLYAKYTVSRTDGSSEAGGKHENDKYFVLNLTTDKHTWPAISAYAKSCEAEYPALAQDLNNLIKEHFSNANQFVTVPETTLPSGLVVPAFQVGKYHCSKGMGGLLAVDPANTPWVSVNYDEAREACTAAGFSLLTESQALAIAHNIVNQDINWSSGKVGKGNVFMGIHRGEVSKAQNGEYEPAGKDERRWHQLSNGEIIFDYSGNLYSWIFDDVQGDEKGIVAKQFSKDSPSISTAPHPSMKKGMGWQPDADSDWAGVALMRGGCWYSSDYAGVFRLYGWGRVGRNDYVGFRCTKAVTSA